MWILPRMRLTGKLGYQKLLKKIENLERKKKAYTMMVMVTMIAVNKRGQKTNS